jgi:hypothetical protein
MSRITQVWELNSEEQDSLWIHDICPYCGVKILNKDLTCDYVYWTCSRCDTTFIVE